MIIVILMFVFAILFFIGPKLIPVGSPYRHDDEDDLAKKARSRSVVGLGVRGTCVVLVTICMLATSFVTIDSDSVGHMKRIYLGKNLPAGRIIALPGEKGPQARVLGPGLNFGFFINVIYDIEEKPVLHVPDSKYCILVSKDGAPLRKGQYLADAWPQDTSGLMSNAVFFMGGKAKEHRKVAGPRGQKGPQLSVLRPGDYRINTYLFNHKFGDALDIPAGYVAVVKSNVQETKEFKQVKLAADGGVLSVPLVEKGSIGIWKEPLYPGKYYLNWMAYKWVLISTRVQTWAYKGGYTKRTITLDVDQKGNITQKSTSVDILLPEGAADGAVTCKVEGWTVPQELRVLFQISPENAPFVVASVGGVAEAENRIVTPAVRSTVRTVIGRAVKGTPEENAKLAKMTEEERAMALGTRVLDLVEKRTTLEDKIEAVLIPECGKARVTIKDIRLAEPIIPPELLVAKLRAQLADQLIAAYKKEQKAQVERSKVEKAQAEADQQPMLVKAAFKARAEEDRKLQLHRQGEGTKLRDLETAKGQAALVAVLGKDRVMRLEMFKMALDAAVKNPNIVKVPTTLVTGGDSGGAAGAAAVLGNSNLVSAFIKKMVVSEDTKK